MKKLLIFLALFALIAIESDAQFWKIRRLEAGAGIGTTQFYGDIGGFSRGENMIGMKDFTFKHTRFNFNLNGRYRILENVSARVNFNLGSLHATDERGSNEGRGFEVKTSFFEPSIMGEYYYLKNKSESSFLMMKGRRMPFQTIFQNLDCYVFTGFGGISYNVKPNAALASKVTKTKGFSPVIPIGLGANLIYSSDFNFGVELGGRFTFTDDLEGYTSAYSEKNDLYFFFNVNCIYKIKLGNKGNPAF